MVINRTTGTPAAEQAEQALALRFGHMIQSMGQYNRRLISGTTSWSQHSWANALDIMLGGSLNKGTPEGYRNGDIIYAWLVKNKTALGIRTILWRVTNHHNHIHIDFWPRGRYTPPTSLTGVGTFRYISGRQISTRIQLVAPEKVWVETETQKGEQNVLKRGMSGPAVTKFQTALMNERSGSLPQYGADGDFGGETEAAVKNVQGRYGLPQTGVIDGVLGGLLLEYVADRVGGGGTTDSTARKAAATAQARADSAHTRLDKLKTI